MLQDLHRLHKTQQFSCSKYINKYSSQPVSKQKNTGLGLFCCIVLFPRGSFPLLCALPTPATAVQARAAQGVEPSGSSPAGQQQGPRTHQAPGHLQPQPRHSPTPLRDIIDVNPQLRLKLKHLHTGKLVLFFLNSTDAVVMEFSEHPSDHGHGQALARTLRQNLFLNPTGKPERLCKTHRNGGLTRAVSRCKGKPHHLTQQTRADLEPPQTQQRFPTAGDSSGEARREPGGQPGPNRPPLPGSV